MISLLRSLVFHALFYTVTFVMMVVLSFVFLLPPSRGWWVVPLWARTCLWMLRVVVGIKIEVRGKENIPQGGYIIAAKHQSAWETFALIPLFPRPTYILKRELQWIPIFGWYTRKFQQIPINRGKRAQALATMMSAAKTTIREGRQILIFPEGTRRPSGAEPKYKYGITHIYREVQCPVVPVALNAGLYWPRQSARLYPGTVIIEILPAIAGDLDADVFYNQMISVIETASDRLNEEARSEEPVSPILENIPRKV